MATLQNSIERVPPQSLEAEESVLGAAMLDRDAIDKAMELLKAEDFYRPAHRKVFEAIAEISGKNEPVDLVTVTEVLKKMNELEAVGGAAFIASLADRVPSAANVEYYAKIVRDKARLRRLISACSAIISSAYQHKDEAQLVVDTAENQILEIGATEGAQKVVSLQELMGGVIEKIEQFRNRGTHVTGLATGFKRLDEMCSGLHGGEMVVVAGRPGMGKTALCMNIARNVAADLKKPVGIFSLEMSADSLAMRLMCSEQRIDSHRLRTGMIQNHELGRLTLAASKLYETPIYLDDSPKLDIQTLRAKVRRMVKEKKVELIVVDYLQLLEAGESRENRQQEITVISRGLKAIAKEMDIPVLVASQLSRATEQRGDKSKPRLSDLRESGSIEQDADMVMLIYRKGYYDKESGDKTAEIDIAKQRSGPTGEFQLIFNGEYTRFDDMAPEQEQRG
jgi:replicative DNA helicase